MKVLVVEDEAKLRSLVVKGLKAEGYAVEEADNGTDAQKRIAMGSFDALVLDIMIPGRDGLSLLRLLRKQGDHTPVVMMTARDTHEEKLEGLNAGADDYIVKPFYVDELVARLKAIWRRTAGQGLSVLQVGELSVNLMTREVMRAGEVIDLQAREFDLLVYLMRNPGRVISRVQLFEHVWDYHFDPETNVVEVYIGRLRRKVDAPFEKKLIKTVRGVGYCIKEA